MQEFVGLAEERRLFYVAITRAKKKLFLTRASRRQTGFHAEDRRPSRFLAELPEDSNIVSVSENYEEPSKEEKLEASKKGLADLKANLFNL